MSLHVTQDGSNSEEGVRIFTKKYSPLARAELAKNLRLERSKASSQSEGVLEVCDRFNQRFREQQIRFQSEKKMRSIENISKCRGVIFVHAIPLGQEGNTQMNNLVIRTEGLTAEQRLENILKNAPIVSCSSVKLNKSGKIYGFENEDGPTYYPFGVVISTGLVLSAHNRDAGTVAISLTARHRKYDKNEPDTTIQPKIEAQLEHAIEGPFSRDYMRDFMGKHGHIDGQQGGHGYKYNEITISEPQISGFFIDDDHLRHECMLDAMGSVVDSLEQKACAERIYRARWDKIRKITAQYPQLEIYIKKDGVTKKG